MAKAKKNAAIETPAAGTAEPEVAAEASRPRQLGEYRFSHKEIPQEVSAYVTDRLGKGAEAHPARSNGGYKGRVLLNSSEYLVQAVGRNNQSAVVHRKADLELMGSNLKWRDENKRLGSVDVQVHYNGDKAQVYTWNRQREDQKRMLDRAEAFAKTIPNAKNRQAFLTNLKEMLEQQAAKGKEQGGSAGRTQARAPAERERATGPER